MTITNQEQEAVVGSVNVDVRNSEDIVDFFINKCRFCKLSYEDKFYNQRGSVHLRLSDVNSLLKLTYCQAI
jgi:hypothetical protein